MAEAENSGGSAGSEPRKRRAGGRPFQPGQSGNPGGRPKGDIARHIREATKDGRVLTDYLLHVVRAKAEDLKALGTDEPPKISERTDAAKLLYERGWGKAPQPLEHSGPEGEQLVINIVRYSDGDK